MNPIGLVRRIAAMGAMGAIGLVGAKSWLDEGRANLRLDYYRDLSAFHESAALGACLTRDAMIDAAMRQGWKVAQEGACLRLVPTAPAPWRPGPAGFLAGFDAEGCRTLATSCE